MERTLALLSLQGKRNHPLINALICIPQAAIVGVFYWLPMAVVFVMKKVHTTSRKCILGLALLLAVLVPVRRWKSFQESTRWDTLLRYFQLDVHGVLPQVENNHSGLLYAVVPHGIVPYSLGLMAFGKLGRLLQYPAIVTASVIKYIPFFSHVLFWGGAVEATTTEIDKVFRKSYAGYESRSIFPAAAITPGGIGEMFLGYPQPGCSPDEEFALLRNRKGFVRISLQYGITIVPIFVFGASKLFHRVVLPAIVERLSRWMRASILLFYGRFGFPLPFPVPLLYSVGQGIALAPTIDPRSEEIDFVHNIFSRELMETFGREKRNYGWEQKKLRIL